MKMRYVLPLVALLLLLVTTLDAQMRYGRSGERPHRGDRSDRIRLHDQLNLSPEQEMKLSALRTNHQKQMIDKRAELQKIRLSINEEMRKDNPEVSTIENMIKQQETIRTSMQLARVQHWNAIREILTPEQREIWQQHRRGFSHIGDRRGFMRRHPRGRW